MQSIALSHASVPSRAISWPLPIALKEPAAPPTDAKLLDLMKGAAARRLFKLEQLEVNWDEQANALWTFMRPRGRMKVQSAFACSSQLTSSCSSLNSRRAAAPFIRSSSLASVGGAAGSFRAIGSGQEIARLGTEACDNAILCIFLTPHLLFLYPNRKLQFEQSTIAR
jgi:hypothetical protein